MSSASASAISKTSSIFSVRFHRACSRTSISNIFREQKRSWHDLSLNKDTGRPAVSKSIDCFVSRDIPVVLLKDIPKVGTKGQIVTVRRGWARSVLVPSGAAVYGTLWENIDRFADPKKANTGNVEAASAASQTEEHPLNWIETLHLEFIREAGEAGTTLLRGVTVWDILDSLSTEYSLDLLPDNVSEENFRGHEKIDITDREAQDEMYKSPIFTELGEHEVKISIMMNNGTRRHYTIPVTIISRTQQVKQLIKEEIYRNKEQKPQFILGVRSRALEMDADVIDEEEALGVA